MEIVQTAIDIGSTICFVIAGLALLGSFGLLVAGREADEGGGDLLLIACTIGLLGTLTKFALPALLYPGASAIASEASAPVKDEDTTPPSPPTPDPAPQAPVTEVGEPLVVPAGFWIAVGVTVLVLLLVMAAVILGQRVLAGRRQRRELRQETERLWGLHVRDLRKLKVEYTAFETDPWTAFRRPLLTDVTEPLTAQFHEKFGRARELHTAQQPSSRELVDLFGDAVREANTAWLAADQHARAVAVPTTTDEERRRLRLAEDALRLALDERTSPAERMVALSRVEQLIAGLTVIPDRARTTIVAELETQTQLAITQSGQ